MYTTVNSHIGETDPLRIMRILANESLVIGDVTIFVPDDLPSKKLEEIAAALIELTERIHARLDTRGAMVRRLSLRDWDVTVCFANGTVEHVTVPAEDDFEAEALALEMYSAYSVESVSAKEQPDRALVA